LERLRAVVAALAALGAFRPWLNVRRHDRVALQEYDDLVTWARDDLQEEARQLERKRAEVAARGMLPSSEFAYQLRRVRDEFARRWRDRSRQAERQLAELRDAEGWAEGAWRWLMRRPWPPDPHADEVASLSRAWRDEDVRGQAVLDEVASIQSRRR
jgi:hypothetical protein